MPPRGGLSSAFVPHFPPLLPYRRCKIEPGFRGARLHVDAGEDALLQGPQRMQVPHHLGGPQRVGTRARVAAQSDARAGP